MRVIGAGLGRTGTSSLKVALEQLLAAPCYHMIELFENLHHIPLWRAAALGNPPDWHDMLADYGATVDWPSASFWLELSEAYPEAIVLLSLRDAESWWDSAHETIFSVGDMAPETDWYAMWNDILIHRFTNQLQDKQACIDAFNRHNDLVRKTIPPERLLEWFPGEGWGPICSALDLPIPDDPFPHTNIRQEFHDTSKELKEELKTVK